MSYHVSKTRFAGLVERAVSDIPQPFSDYLEEISIEIRDQPTRDQLAELGLTEEELLLGLYHGRPRTVRGVEDGPQLPDVIFIFQEDVELVSDSEQQLIDEVRKTVLHEIGHHFGMSEDDLDELGYG